MARPPAPRNDARGEAGGHRATVGPLEVDAVLGDVGGIEARGRRVPALRVDGELCGDALERVPRPGLAVPLIAHLRGQIRQVRLGEDVLVVEDEARIDEVGNPDLALRALLEEVDDGRRVPGHVVAGLGDLAREVEKVASEPISAAHPDRADDIGRVAVGDLGLQRLVRRVGGHDLEADVDRVLGGVVGLDERLLGADLVGVVPQPQADEPSDHGHAGGRGRRRRWRWNRLNRRRPDGRGAARARHESRNGGQHGQAQPAPTH